jgi:hypothetical protein
MGNRGEGGKKEGDRPVDLTRRDGFNEGGREAEFGLIEELLDDIFLPLTDGDEGDLMGMVQDRVGQRDPCRGRLGRIVQPRHPG